MLLKCKVEEESLMKEIIKTSRFRSRDLTRKYGILMVLLLLCIIMAITSPTFRTAQNVINILRQVSVNGIIAIGMTFVIMTGRCV